MNYAILLAAGLSHRMGDTNKLLMKNNSGVPMICSTINELQQSEIDGIILVTGFQSNEILDAIKSFTFIHVHNTNFETGQTSSIQAGVSILPDQCTSLMVCLADMPFISAKQYNKILNEFLTNSTQLNPIIVRPVFNNKPGHPVCFSPYYKKEILACKDTEGCKSVVKNNYTQLIKLNFGDSPYHHDIDTPDDAKNSSYII